MSKADYYLILEVKRSDSHETIKGSYRRLARRYHPDQNQGDPSAEERFKRVVEAWEVLGTPERRRLYDVFGHRMNERGFPGFEGMDLQQVDVFAQLLQQFREGLKARLFRRRGADLRIAITVSFREALLGCTRVFELPRQTASGAIGRKRFEFSIPPGIPTGKVLRWRGFGTPGSYGAEAGALYVTVFVEPHPVFFFEGQGLFCELPLMDEEVENGAVLVVATPWGQRELSVPAGVIDRQLMEMRTVGGLDRAGNRGTLYVRLRVLSSSADAVRRAAHEEARRQWDAYVTALAAGR